MVNPDFAAVFWEVQCPVKQQVRTNSLPHPEYCPCIAPVPTPSPTHHLIRQEVPKSSCYGDCFSITSWGPGLSCGWLPATAIPSLSEELWLLVHPCFLVEVTEEGCPCSVLCIAQQL